MDTYSCIGVLVWEGGFSTRTTHTSRATGEIASHYVHLQLIGVLVWEGDLFNSYDSYESCNWLNGHLQLYWVVGVGRGLFNSYDSYESCNC